MKQDISKLVKAISDSVTDKQDFAEMVEFIANDLDAFTNYFNKVYNDVIGSEVNKTLRACGRIEQEEYEFRVLQADRLRRSAHNRAIDACSQLNRLCERFDVPKFCPESSDRHVIADFVGRFVSEVYQQGISPKDLDHAIEDAKIRAANPDRAYNKVTEKEIEDWSR